MPRYLDSGDASIEIHHNHPSGDSLSAKDLAVLMSRSEISAVTVHGHSGFYARAVRAASAMEMIDDVLLMAQSMSGFARSLTKMAFEAGILTQRQAQSGLWQIVMGLLLENDGRIIYNMNSQSLRDLAESVIDHGG